MLCTVCFKLGIQPWRITSSLICLILHILLSLIRYLLIIFSRIQWLKGTLLSGPHFGWLLKLYRSVHLNQNVKLAYINLNSIFMLVNSFQLNNHSLEYDT